jgi:hypothetical protein
MNDVPRNPRSTRWLWVALAVSIVAVIVLAALVYRGERTVSLFYAEKDCSDRTSEIWDEVSTEPDAPGKGFTLTVAYTGTDQCEAHLGYVPAGGGEIKETPKAKTETVRVILRDLKQLNLYCLGNADGACRVNIESVSPPDAQAVVETLVAPGSLPRGTLQCGDPEKSIWRAKAGPTGAPLPANVSAVFLAPDGCRLTVTYKTDDGASHTAGIWEGGNPPSLISLRAAVEILLKCEPTDHPTGACSYFVRQVTYPQ